MTKRPHLQLMYKSAYTRQSESELKLLTSDAHLPTVRTWLRSHSANFHLCLPVQRVNHIYFDTPEENGRWNNQAHLWATPLRLRWWGETIDYVRPVLEFNERTTVSQTMNTRLNLTVMSWHQLRSSLRPLLQGSLLDVFDRYSWPVLMDSYQRECYLSADRIVRITLHRQIAGFDQRLSHGPSLTNQSRGAGKISLEMQTNGSSSVDFSEAMMASLPLQSKHHQTQSATSAMS